MDLVIVKLGGSILTKKEGYKEENRASIARLAKGIADVYGKCRLVLVHGAGSFGHAPVVRHGINEGVRTDAQKVGFADTHLAVSQLSNMVVEELVKNGVPAISMPPAVICRQDNKAIKEFGIGQIKAFLDAGYLPIVYGDIVLDDSMGGSVVSGDRLMAALAKGLGAKRMVFISDVEGIYVDGKVFPSITKANIESIRGHLGLSGKTDVTGGMYGKVKEIMGSGVPAVVTDAKNMKDAIMGRKVGTSINP
jgi:isopentenyl phosphate kinase